MDVATLNAVYTATSADFDRVTDHVQRRLKETQTAAQAASETARRASSRLISRPPTQATDPLSGLTERQQRAAAESLQRQRSAALITQWRSDNAAVISLQRQRSAALIAEERRVERERIRIARETERELQRLSRPMMQGGTSSLTAGLIGGIAGGITAIVGATAVNAIRQGAAAWLQYSSNLETTRIAFTTMLGSSQAADAHLRELQKFALTTPFQFSELIDASQRMQALGFSAEQVVPILTDVGNAVAAAGGGSERLDRVVLALSQMQSKGKVATQELNQLAESGIGGFKILEQATGKTRAELVKMVEAGQVSSKVFLDAFQKFSQINFGGLMEKQSRTFTGAMSNIKDILLQSSATAFEPLFRAISDISFRISQKLQEGKPSIDAAFTVLTSGLVEAAGNIGGQMAEALIGKITDPRRWAIAGEDPFFLRAFLRGLSNGLPDVEDLFGLGEPAGPLMQAVQIPDLKTPLGNLSQQQKEVSESAKKAGEIVKDLSLKLAFYGQNTEKAAVQQRLLAIGLEALTSAEGRRAIQLAELIDKQRLSAQLNAQQTQLTKDLAAITEGKYTNAFETLTQTIRDSIIQMRELQTAEDGGLSSIERFNIGLGTTIEGLISTGRSSQFSAEQLALLRSALLSARMAMVDLTAAQEEAKRKADVKKLIEQQTELFRSLRGIEVDLTRQLRQIPTDEIQRLAEQLEGLSFLKIVPGGLDLFVEKLRSGAVDAQQAMALISTAIIGAQGDLGEEFNKTTQQIVNLFLKSQQLSDFLKREDATERYKQIVEELQDALLGDTIRTNEARLAKELLKREYDGLTAAQREHLQQLAREVDVADQARAAEQLRLENLREIAGDVGRIFSDMFQLIGVSSDRFWEGLRRHALRFVGDLQEQIFTGLFESLLTGETRRGTGLVGAIADKALGALGVKFTGPDISIADNTKATQANTTAIDALTLSMGGVPAAGGGLGEVLHLVPGLFGGQRAGGGSVEAGKVYQIHNKEFFRPNIGGKIYNLDQMNQAVGQSSGEVRTIVALGDDAVAEAMESHRLTPQGRRAAIVRGRWNRKIGGLQFA